MQEKNLNLRSFKIGCLPIVDHFIDQMGLRPKLTGALRNEGYADALIILLKNILIGRDALYAIREWAKQYDLEEVGDDRIGRALERLFEADRATLQTQVVLSVIKTFELKVDQVHNDTTSIGVFGAYANQDKRAVQLKRGHSKDHRPDLKQLVYSLCVSRDGAVPVHFKCFDGNQGDDGVQWETWNSIRLLLQRPDFIYVGDSKLCVEATLRKIDREHGRFVTVVPRTRNEVVDFQSSLKNGDVRWEVILRKRSRDGSEFDTYEVASGHYQLREGFRLFWYRSSQKRKRDSEDRKTKISRAIQRLENLNLRKGGHRTERVLRHRIDAVLRRYGVEGWLDVEIKMETEAIFKAMAAGKPTPKTRYRRVVKKYPRLHITKNVEAISRAQLMDGIFPLTTNTNESAIEVLQIYKYQPNLEKRHALLKSTLDVAPIWLKKNVRIEALMFVEYLAQMLAALIERELRLKMKDQKIGLLMSLPEGRPSQTPTIDQLLRLFESRSRHELYEKKRLIRTFSEPLTPVQSKILGLLNVREADYMS
jgi:transposase